MTPESRTNVSAWARQRFLGRLLSGGTLAVAGTLAGILIVEGALRWIDIGYGNAPLEAHPILDHVHPRTYRFLSHGPGGEWGGHHIAYDEHGLSSNPRPGEIRGSDCRIAFLGDSFTEAGQVPWKDSFVGIVARSSRCEVRNYGVASYSPILYYLQWQQGVAPWQPDIVFVQLFSNDISDDREYYRKALKDDRGLPVAVPGEENPLVRLLRRSYTARLIRKAQLQISWSLEHWGEERDIVGGFVEERPEISKLTSDMMELLHRQVRQTGANFVVFTVPSQFRLVNVHREFSEPEFADLWHAWCRQRDITYIDLIEPFREAARIGKKLFFDKDIHFNEYGHTVVAQEIETIVTDILNYQRDAGSNQGSASVGPTPPRSANPYYRGLALPTGAPPDQSPANRLLFNGQR